MAAAGTFVVNKGIYALVAFPAVSTGDLLLLMLLLCRANIYKELCGNSFFPQLCSTAEDLV